mgnify:CR=1 FL=1|tara:strand:- start:5435 stop:6301 length:867 start_codon:yes stop_codon:yes gene_type:complete
MSEMKPGVGPNPLQKYFRQPKIYVALPSGGHWYPEGALEMTENGELPVYAMTAQDELMMKTPDALLNGQSVVNVIQSCVPAIKNAWQVPSIDVDLLLIAIRIATYGEKMEIETRVPNAGTERKFDLDLRQLLDRYQAVKFDETIVVGDMKITLRPQTYQEYTRTATKTFEEQRIAQVVQDTEMDEGEKLQRFSASFQKLTAITVDMVVNGLVQVQVGEEVVTNKQHIGDFVKNADKQFFTAITEHMTEQKKKFDVEPFKVETTAEEQEAGAPKMFEVPITFDQSNFFE